MNKSQKRRFASSRSALRRFLTAAIEILWSRDLESIGGMLQNIWSKGPVDVRRQERYMTEGHHLNSDAPGVYSSHEARLNDAGFKIFWGRDTSGKIWAYVGGDQAESHPEAYVILTMILRREGLLSEGHEEMAPLTKEWWLFHRTKLEPWAMKWIRENKIQGEFDK